MCAWENVKLDGGKPEKEDKPLYSKEEIEKWIKDGKERSSSFICCGLHGSPEGEDIKIDIGDGTGKSGSAIDCRTKEDIEAGRVVFVIDVDGGCGEIKEKYFDGDENIIIFDPFDDSFTKDGDIDESAVYNKIKTMLTYLYENQDEMNLHAVILDGVDSMQKTCEGKMREEDLKINKNARLNNSFSWGIRNQYYRDVMTLMKKLRCHRFFITHIKDKREFVNNELVVTGKEVDWHYMTPGMLSQRVETKRVTTEDGVKFVGVIRKCKGALHLEDKEYTIAEVKNKEVKWYGLMDLWAEIQERSVDSDGE